MGDAGVPASSGGEGNALPHSLTNHHPPTPLVPPAELLGVLSRAAPSSSTSQHAEQHVVPRPVESVERVSSDTLGSMAEGY
eukprot:m.127830 g.127830  ORF g.127830 m.127830 type:complete len:81 (-) comp14719_c0_seq2:2308-2550(-)